MVANIFEDFKPPSEKILAATLLPVCPYSYQNSYVSQNSSQCLVLKFLRRWKGFLKTWDPKLSIGKDTTESCLNIPLEINTVTVKNTRFHGLSENITQISRWLYY